MTVYATIKQAALEAARMAWPGLPEDWVAWDEEPARQYDIGVTLLAVSQVAEDTEPVEVMVPEGTRLRVELCQRALLNVDVRLESTMGSMSARTSYDNEERHFLDAARTMLMAWHTRHVAGVLGGPTVQDKAVVVATGDIINRSADRNGVTLPMCSYEVQFRALVGRVTDPTRRGRITSIAAVGSVDGNATDGIEVGPP